MAHNLHLVVIKSASAEKACKEVESFIEDFGNENNWREICGCVSQDNEVLDKTDTFGGGRWKPTDCGYTTIDIINKMIIDELKPRASEHNDKLLNKLKTDDLSTLNRGELYSLKKLVNEQIQLCDLDNDITKFNVLEDDYYPYQFDEFGITQCEWVNGGDNDKLYVVFVDMHS